jgi:hypothetical protein
MASSRMQQESFRKRKNNYIRRGNDLSQIYEVAVYVCICKENGQYYIYNSNPTRPDWPPSSEQLVSLSEDI